jgi:hypothetical protein
MEKKSLDRDESLRRAEAGSTGPKEREFTTWDKLAPVGFIL